MHSGGCVIAYKHTVGLFQASGGEWNKDLLFKVPREHEEVQRLEGRYKKSVLSDDPWQTGLHRATVLHCLLLLLSCYSMCGNVQ